METAGSQTDHACASTRVIESNQRNLIAGLEESKSILDVSEICLAFGQDLKM
jgi:hypothetical protein